MNIPELEEPTYAETITFIKDKNNWESYDDAVVPPDILLGINVLNRHYKANISYMIQLHADKLNDKGDLNVKSLEMSCMIENLGVHPADPSRISQAVIYKWPLDENDDSMPLNVPQLTNYASIHYLKHVIWPGTPADQPILIINKSLEE